MRKILLLVILGYSSNLLSQDTCLNVYLNCINYIKGNKVAKDFIREQLGTDTALIVVSEKTIPFKHYTVIEDVIRKDYNKDFSFMKAFQESEIYLEKKINDSLINLDEEYNKNYPSKIYNELNVLSDSREPNLVLFFSQIVNQSIYLELFPFTNKDIPEDNKNSYIMQGQSLTFLLELNKYGKVCKSYHGIIQYE